MSDKCPICNSELSFDSKHFMCGTRVNWKPSGIFHRGWQCYEAELVQLQAWKKKAEVMLKSLTDLHKFIKETKPNDRCPLCSGGVNGWSHTHVCRKMQEVMQQARTLLEEGK